MIHDQLMGKCIANVCFADLLVDHRVHDTHSAIYAEGQRHLFVHCIEVRINHLTYCFRILKVVEEHDSGISDAATG